MSYTKSRRRASLGLWDPRHAGQTMPEPVINRAYIPGLAYASGVPGTIDSEPNTMQGLGDCLGCGQPQGLLRGLGAVKKGSKKSVKVGLHIPVILPPVPVVPVVPPVPVVPVVPPDNAPAPAPDANVPAVVPDGAPGPYAAESKAPYYWGLGVGLLLGGLVGYKLGCKKRPA